MILHARVSEYYMRMQYIWLYYCSCVQCPDMNTMNELTDGKLMNLNSQFCNDLNHLLFNKITGLTNTINSGLLNISMKDFNKHSGLQLILYLHFCCGSDTIICQKIIECIFNHIEIFKDNQRSILQAIVEILAFRIEPIPSPLRNLISTFAEKLLLPPMRSTSLMKTESTIAWMVSYLTIYGLLGEEDLGFKIRELRRKNKLPEVIRWQEIKRVVEKMNDYHLRVKILVVYGRSFKVIIIYRVLV